MSNQQSFPATFNFKSMIKLTNYCVVNSEDRRLYIAVAHIVSVMQNSQGQTNLYVTGDLIYTVEETVERVVQLISLSL